MTSIILIFILLLLTFFFSAAEMAFVSCNKIRLRHFVSEGLVNAATIEKHHRNPKDLLATILFGNNLVNVSITALIALVFKENFNIENELFVTAVAAPFIIILGETVPKDLARQKADVLIYQFAPLIEIFYKLLKPFCSVILSVSDFLLGSFGSLEKKSPFVTKEEFRYLMEEGAKKGVIKEHEKRLVDIILNFERIRVYEVMTPLNKVAQIDITKKVGDLKTLARKTGGSFALVYEEIPSLIVGSIHVFDTLFEEDDTRPLTHFLRAPMFVFKDLSAEKAFLRLQEKRQSFAVVLDESREAVGIISIDNLLAV